MWIINKALYATVLMGLATSAYGADIITQAPQEELPFTWSGFYGGIDGDWVINGDASYRIPAAKDLKPDHELGGPLLGAQVGYNYQLGWLLLGGEMQGDWANISGDKDY